MKTLRNICVTVVAAASLAACNSPLFKGEDTVIANAELSGSKYDDASFDIESARITYEPLLDSYVFTIEAKEDVASVVPIPAGQVDGAPVLGYVFVTDLLPSDIGYQNTEGKVALAVTSHPDFDDTPLWDENNNQSYDDDGVLYHSHWVVLDANNRALTGLAVKQATDNDVLTPTSPMAMYLDSPGYTIIERDEQLHVLVPANGIKRRTNFTANALTAYLEVEVVNEKPLLKVENIYDKFEGEITVNTAGILPRSNWPVTSLDASDDSIALAGADVTYVDEFESLIFTIKTKGNIATKAIPALGKLDGAPALGYVFPTTLAIENVGFKNLPDATLALAVTIHPDFDDTPLWDEDNNNNFKDDGAVYHTHWVALVKDTNSSAGLSIPFTNDSSNLPPTAPMPMYLDSPNFHAYAKGNLLRVIVPLQRVNGVKDFNFDAVIAGMNVDLSGEGPTLRVNQVHGVLSKTLSLPFTVQERN